MNTDGSPETQFDRRLRRLNLLFSTLAGVVAIIAFLIDQPRIGYVFLGVTVLVACFLVLILAGRKNVLIASALGVVLVALAFFIGYQAERILTGENSAVLPVEQASVIVYPYDGEEDPQFGYAYVYVAVGSSRVDGKPVTRYDVEYDLPAEGDSWAGVSLWFSEPLDISEYNFLELTIRFGDPQTRFRLFLKDAFDEDDYIVLGDGTFVSAQSVEQTIQVPIITYFPHISRKSVREIVFDANADETRGNHSFTVSRVQFLK